MVSEKPKVCFVTATLNPGGTERFLLNFLKLHSEDFNASVLVKSNQLGELQKEFEELGIHVIHHPVGYINIPKLLALYRKLKNSNYDTICDLTGNFSGLVMLVAQLSGIRNRITFYRNSSHFFKETTFKKAYSNIVNRLAYNYSTKLLSNSKSAFDFYFPGKQVLLSEPEKFKVIPNGVNAAKFNTGLTKEKAREQLSIPKGVFLIGHVGRYDPAKNHETVFKVAAELKKTNSNVRFLFCGKDTNGTEFKNRLKAHGIEDICFPIGLTNDLPVVLKALDLFYFPSLTEGQPNAMIEAMVAGVAVLPADIPPILEALPKKAKTIEATDVKSAVEQISRLIAKSGLLDTLRYKQWAIGRFDYEKNFELFKCELNG